MAIRNIDGILNYLEKTAEDELSHLEATGPEFFTTAQLLRLRGQWEVKNLLFKKFQKLIIRLIAYSPVWIVIYYIFEIAGWRYLALTSLIIFPLSFVLFFAGLVFMWRFFKGKGHLDQVGDLIDEELRKRSGKHKRL